tara:strand:- start:5497 stop:5994 length:498 start_codon:yes stop_codon:yes gene_type:complete
VNKEFRVTIPEFMTHANKSKNKYMKINGQRLYSGLNPHVRSAIVKQMHDYVRDYINKQLKGVDLSKLGLIRIRLEFHAPINYGDVRMFKGEVRWKAPKDDYIAGWDVDNMWIWGKIFNDTLTEEGFIVDDSASYVSASGEVMHVPVKTFDERKLVFVISKCNQWT